MNKPDKDRKTVKPVNLLQHLDKEAFHDVMQSWTEFMSQVSEKADRKLVDAYKERFGRQDYTFTAYQRYWVWEFAGYRVYVNNGRGINLEVEVGTTPEEARDCIKNHVEMWHKSMKTDM